MSDLERDDLDRRVAAGIRSTPPLPDRERFVDRVMQRVQTAEREAPRRYLQPATPLPWWIQAAADPAAVLACVLLALVLWDPEALSVATHALTGWTVPGALIAWARSSLLLDRPTVALVFQLFGCFGIGWISVHLYGLTQRVVLRA